jgi:glucan 1,3-beta-glucosidase
MHWEIPSSGRGRYFVQFCVRPHRTHALQIGNSTAGKVESPLWSYKLGLENGWIPKDPRVSTGKCAALGVNGTPFDGTYLPWQTGTTSSISPSATRSYPWPPTSLNNPDLQVDQLPMYTPTGTVTTLPPPTSTASGGHSLNGWANGGDNTPAPTPIVGCRYPDPWDATSARVPPSGCSTGVSSQPTV